MRYDFFMILGNGIQYSNEIINLISKEYKILYTKDIEYNDPNKFIDDIYGCDNVPIEHLRAKSRYLLNAPKKAIFILIENHNPKEESVGEGEFKHIQCVNIRNFKFLLREKFNPPHKNPNFQNGPLSKGVSHDHVLHSSDYESQVFYMLNLFKLPKPERTLLDVRKFFIDMPSYCIIRKPELWPTYHTYKDVDFLVENIQESRQHIINVSNDIGWNGDIRVRDLNSNWVHIDFHLPDGSLDFKFDMVNTLDYNFLDSNFHKLVIRDKILHHGLSIPSIEHDRILRGAEYIKNPQKTKYKEFEKYIR